MEKSQIEDVLSRIEPERREFVRKLLVLGFVVPAVATFSMSGLESGQVWAGSNMTTSFV